MDREGRCGVCSKKYHGRNRCPLCEMLNCVDKRCFSWLAAGYLSWVCSKCVEEGAHGP